MDFVPIKVKMRFTDPDFGTLSGKWLDGLVIL